jgi:hypothetical protein
MTINFWIFVFSVVVLLWIILNEISYNNHLIKEIKAYKETLDKQDEKISTLAIRLAYMYYRFKHIPSEEEVFGLSNSEFDKVAEYIENELYGKARK